ncbi:MAG: tRNA (guanosine(37)-N1)-methyltransferase TrmD [Candidatus Nomurabacteria bacterium]|nr:tRNA (guanosine(37)-N1)-methyltransferase TrmD [Candidatus Nomurabacteria bacterium]
MTTFHIITIFPDMFTSYLGESILARAIADKKIAVKFYNPRDNATNKHNRVDDKPYGGGPGMVMQAEPILRAVKKARGRKQNVKIIMTSAGGKEFTNAYAKNVSKKHDHIIIICGRYEGIDARVRKALHAQEINVGDYVLTGGELPAMIMIDAMSRQIPGVLGKFESVEENRISSHETYTRPDTITFEKKNYRVPPVLLSGHQKKIDEWRSGK